MVIRLQVRHDTKANWETQNPVLAVGELGIETDNPNGIKIKVGDGNKNWISHTQMRMQFIKRMMKP